MIDYSIHGDFSKLSSKLQKILGFFSKSRLDKYGRRGVELLSEATPVDTGLAASSWDYYILNDGNFQLVFINTDIEDGALVVELLDSGHITRDGTFKNGLHFIDPCMNQLMDEISKDFKTFI